jgi:hypothetical protein
MVLVFEEINFLEKSASESYLFYSLILKFIRKSFLVNDADFLLLLLKLICSMLELLPC